MASLQELVEQVLRVKVIMVAQVVEEEHSAHPVVAARTLLGLLVVRVRVVQEAMVCNGQQAMVRIMVVVAEAAFTPAHVYQPVPADSGEAVKVDRVARRTLPRQVLLRPVAEVAVVGTMMQVQLVRRTAEPAVRAS
jgi:hypothetical protein